MVWETIRLHGVSRMTRLFCDCVYNDALIVTEGNAQCTFSTAMAVNNNSTPCQSHGTLCDAHTALALTHPLSSELKAKLLPLIDRHGLLHDTVDHITGNGLLYSAHLLLGLWQNNLQWEEWEARLPSAITKCEIEPGFFHRHPTEYHDDQQGPDDYIGIASLCSLLGPFGFFKASQVVGFGWKGFLIPNFIIRLWFYFPNEIQYRTKFGSRAWLIKFPAVFTAFYQVARRSVFFPFQIYWAASVLLGDILDRKHKHDPWILNWHLVNTCVRFSPNWFEVCTIKLWLWRLRKRWPGGIAQCIEESFQYRHPVCELVLDIFPSFAKDHGLTINRKGSQ